MIDKELLLEWLGIPPDQCPPNHYQLLGVRTFETNTDAIRNAADRQYSHVKRMAVNEFTDVGQKLLDQIMAAKICLLNPEKRSAYDAKLQVTTEASPALADPRASESEINADDGWDQVQDYTLIVGADPQCDIQVNEPAVSAVHCKLVRKQDQIQIRDMASTNGTFLNGHRISKETLSPADFPTIGPKVMLEIPPRYLPRSFRDANLRIVGRSPQCHIHIDDSSVSHFHAKIYSDGTDVIVEDLRSTNGTKLIFDDSRIRRVMGRAPLANAQGIAFGSRRVDRATLAQY